MDKYIASADIRKYLFLPNNFDAKLIDQSVGFSSKVFPYFPEEFIETIKASTGETEKKLYDLILNAGIRYSFILSIPALKVHISNFGINQFNQGKETNAAWWDVRDLGLSMLKAADQFLSDALDLAFSVPAIKDQLPFFENNTTLLPTPSVIDSIFSIGKSPEVYTLLQTFIQRSMELIISEKLEPCSIEDINTNPTLAKYLKEALLFYGIASASEFIGLTFLHKQIVVQYEELPWQKSVVLSEEQRTRAGKTLSNLADQNIDFILKYIRKNIADFPCYAEVKDHSPKIYKKPGGLFL